MRKQPICTPPPRTKIQRHPGVKKMTARPQSFLSLFAQFCILAAIIFSLFSTSGHAQQPAPVFINTLMPLPATLESKPGALAIDNKFSYALHGDSGPRLADAAIRLITRLETRTGIQLEKSPAPATQQPTLAIDVATASTQAVPQPGDRRKLYPRRRRPLHHPPRQNRHRRAPRHGNTSPTPPVLRLHLHLPRRAH